MADLRDFTGKNRKFTGTIGERISTGTTAQRDDSTFGSGTLRFNSSTNLMEYYTGTEWKSIDAPPTITFVTIDGGADTTSGQVDNESSGNVTIQVKGSLFDTTNGAVTFIGTGETLTPATTTRNNSGLFTCVLPASSFDTANSPYTVKIINGSGLFAELVAGVSADQTTPVFATSAGSLGTIRDSTRASYTLLSAAATDADSDAITYSISAGSIPTGLSFNTSTAAITGTASAVGSNTTSTFTVTAATANGSSTRQFTITVNAPETTTFGYTGGNQTFTPPAGVTSVNAYIWGAGGGGGNSGGWSEGSPGGGGGYASGTVAVSSSNTYIVIVGGGGGIAGDGNGAAFGGGGVRGSTGDNQYAASGGGLSGIFLTSYTHGNSILIAGGGGGGGSQNGGPGDSTEAGGGGGTTGQAGEDRDEGRGSGEAGRGGTQSSGGSGGSGQSRPATSGGQLQGGNGGGETYGGGGGGGYYGGGGGGYSESPSTMGGGGGGSGYSNPSYVTSATLTASTSVNPPETGNTFYGSSAGVGGPGHPSRAVGNAGRVVITF